MIDVLTILVTSGAILFVVIRALMLDRSMPWFTPTSGARKPDRKDAPAGQTGWRERASSARVIRGDLPTPPWRSR